MDTTNFNNPARYLVEVRDEGASYTVINRYYTSNHYALNSWDSVNLVEPQGTSLSSASGREELFPVLGGKTI